MIKDTGEQVNYRYRFIYEERFGRPLRMWTCIGQAAGLHLHIQDFGEKHRESYGEQYSGGVEIHYRFPPDYMANEAPSHDECWLLKCPCWHDGSSEQATEFWIPQWLACGDNHQQMFKLLGDKLSERLEGTTFAGFKHLVSQLKATYESERE